MESLFKRIDGNTFKLNETVKESTSGYEWNISKQEEEQAFQFMKRQVVPKLVSNYNFDANRRSKLSDFKIYRQITVKEIIQNLRKMSHKKYDEKGNFHGSDYINYRSMIDNGKGPIFDFYIDKAAGNLHVSYDVPFQSTKMSHRVGANYT